MEGVHHGLIKEDINFIHVNAEANEVLLLRVQIPKLNLIILDTLMSGTHISALHENVFSAWLKWSKAPLWENHNGMIITVQTI